MARKIGSVILILALVFGLLIAYIIFTSYQRAGTAIGTVGDLFNELVIPATPVILPDPALIVGQINDVARLETATVELEKVITAERNSEVLFGALGETLIFIANGKIVAGVDFTEMSTDDIRVVDPETVWVHLPEARIFDDLPVLDNDKSYVADRDTGLLARADQNLETQVRQAAEQTIREEAIQTGVVETAERNAELFIENFLTGLGFTNVVFYDETPPMPPAFEQVVPKGQTLATPTPGG